MRLNIGARIAHFGQLFPRNRLAAAEMSALNAFGINEERDRISEFLQDGPGDLVLRFPAIVEGDDGAARWDTFLTASPGEIILHADYGDTLVFEHLHLCLEIRRSDLSAWRAHLINKAMITKNDGLRGLIDNHLAALSNGCYCAGRRWDRR